VIHSEAPTEGWKDLAQELEWSAAREE
jgi:hypothetical protein